MFLNVSSIGGLVTFPLISLYHSTKWAVEGFSESLSYGLGELGIQVKLIEPGGVSTDFSGRSLDMAMPNDLPDYLPGVQKFMAARENASSNGSTAEYMAEKIFEATTDGKSQLRYLLGEDALQTYSMREQVGDDAFIAGMRERMLS